MTWQEVAALSPIFLNLGGGAHCRPDPAYSRYVAVDLVPRAEFAVAHDLRRPVPLADGSVARILSEHFLEHLEPEALPGVLSECHRLLAPGGLFRLAVPDYGHPRRRHCLAKGRDPRRADHRTLTTYPQLRALIAGSPFRDGDFLHYWDGDRFVERPIDYTLGFVRRTPDHDPRNQCRGLTGQLARTVRDLGEYARHGLGTREIHLQTRRYHRLAVTSIVVDLVKQPG